MTSAHDSSASVVIPCYNAEKSISRTLQSVLSQANPHVEIIVIDDGSTDGSHDIIKSFGSRIRWQANSNQGACIARNSGLGLATSQFILFLDADDYLEPNSLAEWAAVASDADIVFGPFAYEEGGVRTPGRPPIGPLSRGSILSQWLNGWFTPPCSVMWRTSFLRGIRGWSPNALRNQDGEVVMRGLLRGARPKLASKGLGVYVQHETAGRVSKRVGRDVFASELASLEGLWALAQATRQTQLQPSFAFAFYRLAYTAFSNRIDDIGESAIKRSRQLGLTGYPGGLAHRTLSSLLGLKNKLHLTGIAKRRSQTLPSSTVPNRPAIGRLG